MPNLNSFGWLLDWLLDCWFRCKGLHLSFSHSQSINQSINQHSIHHLLANWFGNDYEANEEFVVADVEAPIVHLHISNGHGVNFLFGSREFVLLQGHRGIKRLLTEGKVFAWKEWKNEKRNSVIFIALYSAYSSISKMPAVIVNPVFIDTCLSLSKKWRRERREALLIGPLSTSDSKGHCLWNDNRCLIPPGLHSKGVIVLIVLSKSIPAPTGLAKGNSIEYRNLTTSNCSTDGGLLSYGLTWYWHKLGRQVAMLLACMLQHPNHLPFLSKWRASHCHSQTWHEPGRQVAMLLAYMLQYGNYLQVLPIWRAIYYNMQITSRSCPNGGHLPVTVKLDMNWGGK